MSEVQEIPEICNCQEPKCIKRVDAAIEAMREAAARECVNQIVGCPSNSETHAQNVALWKATKAIRALKDLK